jgi:uncharacterized protein (TIGR02246 family)
MLRSLALLLTLLVALTAGACTRMTTPATSADLKAIQELRSNFEAAMAAGDADKAASLYGPDAIRMVEGQPSIMGREAILASYRMAMANDKLELSLNSEETKVAGDWAFDRGQFMNHVTPKAGGPMVMEMGKYLVILQKQADGSWKVAREIGNSNEPPPAPAPTAPAPPAK